MTVTREVGGEIEGNTAVIMDKDIANKTLHDDQNNAEYEGNEEEYEMEYNKLFYRDIFDFFDWNNSNTIPASVSIYLCLFLPSHPSKANNSECNVISLPRAWCGP